MPARTSNELESDWPLSLGCSIFRSGPMDMGQMIHTCSFHESIVGWAVSRTDGHHSAIVTAGGVSRASGIACAGLPSVRQILTAPRTL